MTRRLQVFLISLCLIPNFLHAQVVINEVQTANLNTITDEYGAYDDWIELYNNSAAPVDLTGYMLSDNLQQHDKFVFPFFTIDGHDHVIIFASDYNKSDYGTHWETALNASDIWKYQANYSAPADTNWRNLSFNANAWSSGQGGIGLGDGDDVTVISTCISVYMRRIFTIADTSKISAAILHMDYDDSFVAYLNGVEVARSNVGVAGIRPAWDLAADVSHEAVMYQAMLPDSFGLDMNKVRAAMTNGLNVFAVEVHNTMATNQDMSAIPFLSFKLKDATTMFGPTPAWFPATQSQNYFHAAFKLSRSGESVYLFNPSATLVDSVMVTSLEPDDSYGRNPDGSAQWCFTNLPTPDTVNTTGLCKTGYATIPLFGLQPGFYPNTQSLTITTTFPGGVIHYTTNGNAPDGNSPIYSGPITITSTKSVRARVYALNVLPSQVVTGSYIIGVDCKLPALLKGVKAIGKKYGFRSVCYGHAGDGNLHVNIIKENLSDEAWNTQVPKGIREIFELCVSLGGTISGEHGIGYVQKNYLDIAFSKTQIELMKGIKKVFDPTGILNPGKIFP